MDNKRERRDEEEKTAEATINLCFNATRCIAFHKIITRNETKRKFTPILLKCILINIPFCTVSGENNNFFFFFSTYFLLYFKFASFPSIVFKYYIRKKLEFKSFYK